MDRRLRLSDDSSSLAAAGSSNVSAAVLLAPNTLAKAESCRTLEERIKLASLKISAAEARINAAPPATRADSVQLRLDRQISEKTHGWLVAVASGKGGGSVPSPHDLRQAEQLGADLQLILLGNLRVDLETNPVLVQEEIDRAAVLGEPGLFAHQQTRGPLRLLDRRRLFFRADGRG